jgi:hypothetical protein
MAPERLVWPPSAKLPKLLDSFRLGWSLLQNCPECQTLWVVQFNEPYASFRYFVFWPYSAEFWLGLVKKDDGILVSRWCTYQIQLAWPSMGEKDREAIEHHRRRSLGRNPIDEILPAQLVDPLAPYL